MFTAATHRVVRLRQERADGNWTEADLLRSVAWLAARGIRAGGERTVPDLPEMGVSSVFQVLAIEPCPEIEAGPGQTVTALFRHGRGRVYDARVEGESKALGSTGSHPFWSMDRNAWVPAGELRIGERVRVMGRTAPVRQIEERGDEPTHNLDVDGDHCSRVGERGDRYLT